MYGNDEKMATARGEKISWPLTEQYPACKNLDIHELFSLKNQTSSYIVFTFHVLENLGIALFVEERNKATSRSLKFNRFAYSGPTITIGTVGTKIFGICTCILGTWDAPTIEEKSIKNI